MKTEEKLQSTKHIKGERKLEGVCLQTVIKTTKKISNQY